MKLARKILFWTHLVVGIAIGLGVAFMAVTGIMMAFQPQIVAWAEGANGAPPTPAAQKLDVETLLTKARELDEKENPTQITLRSDPHAPATVQLGRERRVHLNAYTGAQTGVERPQLREFFETVEHAHRWLAATGDLRWYTRGFTGVVGIAFLGLCVSGLILWFPRAMRWNAFKAVLLPSLRLKGKPRDWNWHNTVGFWALVPLLVITITGTIMSYDWANGLLFRAMGSEPPAPRQQNAAAPQGQGQGAGRGEGRGGANRGNAERRPLNVDGYEKLVNVAATSIPDWTELTLRLSGGRQGRGQGPGTGAGIPNGVSVMVAAGNPRNPVNRTTLTLDRKTAEIIKTETFADQDNGRAARSLVVPIHRGEILGLPGQIVMALASAGAVLLVYTGFALTTRRALAAMRRRREAVASSTAPSSLSNPHPA